MGQKINPTGFRLSVNRDWASKWYANSKHFPATLNEDIKVRDYLRKKLSHASVGKITIERPAKNARITIHSARPGVVIGKKGEDIETLRASLRKMMGTEVGLNIEEIRKPEIDAQLVADQIRGLPVDKALTLLSFSPKKGAKIIKKVLESAIANAEHNEGADIDELKVRTICVDKAANLRRFTARAKGRGNVILKQTCHIHVTVGDGK